MNLNCTRVVWVVRGGRNSSKDGCNPIVVAATIAAIALGVQRFTAASDGTPTIRVPLNTARGVHNRSRGREPIATDRAANKR